MVYVLLTPNFAKLSFNKSTRVPPGDVSTVDFHTLSQVVVFLSQQLVFR